MNDCALFFHFIFSSFLFFHTEGSSTIIVEFWFHVSMDFAVGWWRGGGWELKNIWSGSEFLFFIGGAVYRAKTSNCVIYRVWVRTHIQWVRGKWHYLRSTQYCWFSALICFSKRNHPICSVGKNYIVDTIIHFYVRVLLFNNHINIHYS